VEVLRVEAPRGGFEFEEKTNRQIPASSLAFSKPGAALHARALVRGRVSTLSRRKRLSLGSAIPNRTLSSAAWQRQTVRELPVDWERQKSARTGFRSGWRTARHDSVREMTYNRKVHRVVGKGQDMDRFFTFCPRTARNRRSFYGRGRSAQAAPKGPANARGGAVVAARQVARGAAVPVAVERDIP